MPMQTIDLKCSLCGKNQDVINFTQHDDDKISEPGGTMFSVSFDKIQNINVKIQNVKKQNVVSDMELSLSQGMLSISHNNFT